MDKIMEKLNKLSLPITILIASVILGSFYYTSQVSKQKSIEKQQQIEIEQKTREQQASERRQEMKLQEDRRIEEIKAEQEKIKEDALAEQERQMEEAKVNCINEAHERRVKMGQEECFESGYTQEDIGNLKCKLPITKIKILDDKQTSAQDFCLKLYN